jgi:hypothetical protein
MIIGTMFLGKVKEINKQWIETKFVVIGVPLFPTSSMLVTSSRYKTRQGINIPLDATSVIAGYARLFTFIAALVAIFIGAAENSLLTQLLGLALAGLWVYFYFNFGKAKPHEIEQRTKLGKAIGLYALPHWFDFDDALRNFKTLQFHYKDKFQNADWKEDLMNPGAPADRKPFLYALALFNYMIAQSPENETLLNAADRLNY